MNVLWLAAAPHPAKSGHPTPWITTLANRLVATGDVGVTIVSYNTSIDRDDEIVKDGVKYTYLKVPTDKWDLLSGYSRRIKRVKSYVNSIARAYDLLHIHGTEQQYHVMGADLSLPKVLSAQGFVTEYARYLPRKPEYKHLSWAIAGYYEKRYAPTIKHFICRTHWDKAVIRQLQPKAVIHHNWELMRPEFYAPVVPHTAEVSNAMLFVGGLNTMKGIREALQALNLLRQQLPIRLIVTGYGTNEELLQLAASLSFQHVTDKAVEHRGMLSAADLWATYHEVFCLLHPSYIDNSPNSVCEAQLAGLPVIASNVGGVSSLIENQKTGMLTTLQPNQIAATVNQLWHSPHLRSTLSTHARAVSLERFDQQQITSNTKAIYEEVVINP